MADTDNEEPAEGWGGTIYGPAQHFYVEKRSLCRRYEWLGDIINRKLATECNHARCKACERKKAARDAKAAKIDISKPAANTPP